MLYILYVFLFILGTAAGSFLNVLSLRYREGERIFTRDVFTGRSHCPYCGKTLNWRELIPLISFIVQKGKCRSCGRPLSLQYPFVEVLSGLIFVTFPVYFYRYFHVADLALGGQPFHWYYWILGVWIAAAGGLILMSAIDFRLRIIPDQLNLFLAFLGIILIAVNKNLSFLGGYALLFKFTDNVLLNHLAAAGAGLAFFGLVILFSRGRGMGMGDLKLAGALGLLLGWPDAILSFLLSFIIGAIISLGLIFLKKKSFKDAVPFGPFLAAGVFTVMFFGEKILNYYFQLFS